MSVDCSQLWSKSADTRWPFHGEVIADVAAHQWWMGANPEALRKENMELFDINKVPLSSNLFSNSPSGMPKRRKLPTSAVREAKLSA